MSKLFDKQKKGERISWLNNTAFEIDQETKSLDSATRAGLHHTVVRPLQRAAEALENLGMLSDLLEEEK